MVPFILTVLLAFGLYLLLTAGSGSTGVWASSEILIGLILACAVGAVARNFLCRHRDYRMSNPLRLIRLFVYVLVPFFVEMAVANLNVAYRVITGRIRPGIMRVRSDLKTDLGVLMLANSITLTPGTLSVDIDEDSGDLFVHIINIDEGEERKELLRAGELFTVSDLAAWIRRIAE